MKYITEAQYAEISHCFPPSRGRNNHTNLHILNAMLYLAENGCKWRALPPEFGPWHTVYMRVSRWAKAGILARVFTELKTRFGVDLRAKLHALDSTTVKVHPDGTGALKKTVRKASAARTAG